MKEKQETYHVSFAGLSCRVTSSSAFRNVITKYFQGTFVRVTDYAAAAQERTVHIRILAGTNASGGIGMRVRNRGLRFDMTIRGSPHFFYPMVAGVFQRVFTALWYRTGGVVIHASAVEYEGRAYLFAGRSGRGKTTLVRILHEEWGLPVRADNQAFIIKRGDVYELYPFPFSQFHKDGTGAHMPVAALSILHHARRFRTTPVTFMDVMRAFGNDIQVLSAEGVPPDRSVPKTLQQTLFDFARLVPVQHLHFRPEKSVWETVLDGSSRMP